MSSPFCILEMTKSVHVLLLWNSRAIYETKADKLARDLTMFHDGLAGANFKS